MDDLVQWLREQLDEDDRIAQAASAGPWSTRWTGQDHELVAPARAYPIAEWTYAIATQEPEASAHRAECDTANADHIARHDPARVLREINAKRQLLADMLSEPHFMSADDHYNTCPAIVDEDGVPVCLDESRAPGPCECGRDARVARRLHLLALPYADRPGYRDDWRP